MAVHFALLVEKMADCHTVVGFGMGVGRNLVEGDSRLMVADMAQVVKQLARMTEVVGKEELGQGLA